MKRIFALALALALPACTTIDSTNHCLELAYGKPVSEKMAPGLNYTGPFAGGGSLGGTDAVCFPLTQQAYPIGSDKDGQALAEPVEANTKDPMPVNAEIALTYSYTDVPAAFRAKRDHYYVVQELQNAVRSGFRDAMTTVTVADLFSEKRAEFDEAVRTAIQRQMGPYVRIDKVYLRDIKVPKAITEARIAAVEQQSIMEKQRQQYLVELEKVRKQSEVDSINARRTVMNARAAAEKTELENRALAQSPEVLRLRAIEAQAKAMAGICGQSSTCIIGGNVVDKWMTAGGKP